MNDDEKAGPSNRSIRGIDLKPGQFVVVQKWLDEAALDPAKPLHDMIPAEIRVATAPRKPVGDPVKVLHTAFPFFTVEICCNGMRGVIDSRNVDLMLVDKKYVRSLLPLYFKNGANATPIDICHQAQALMQRAFAELQQNAAKSQGYQVALQASSAPPKAGA